jgi:hypothetical protein
VIIKQFGVGTKKFAQLKFFYNFAVGSLRHIFQPNEPLISYFIICKNLLTMDQAPTITRTEEYGVKVHIGSLISSELRRQRRPAAWLAQEICCDRTNVYKILRKGSIDTELLCRISVALNHDFFIELQHACGFDKTVNTNR